MGTMEQAAELPGAGTTIAEHESAEVQTAEEHLIETERVLLREMPVYLPEEQVLINGEPFGFKLEQESLSRLVNTAEQATPGRFKNPIKSLSLQLGNSLPAQLSDEKPKEQIYDPKKDRLELMLPEALASPNDTTDALKQIAEKSINDQIELGLLQSAARSIRGNKAWQFFKGMTFSAAPVAGVTVGFIERQPDGSEIAIGAGAGFGVAAIGLGGAMLYNRKFDEKVRNWAKKTFENRGSLDRRTIIDDTALANPVIELVPLGEASDQARTES